MARDQSVKRNSRSRSRSRSGGAAFLDVPRRVLDFVIAGAGEMAESEGAAEQTAGSLGVNDAWQKKQRVIMCEYMLRQAGPGPL